MTIPTATQISKTRSNEAWIPEHLRRFLLKEIKCNQQALISEAIYNLKSLTGRPPLSSSSLFSVSESPPPDDPPSLPEEVSVPDSTVSDPVVDEEVLLVSLRRL